VKNTLATVQAITALTLKGAEDLPRAREALDRRIASMAKAHDLLRARDWTCANLAEVVARSLDAFAVGQIEVRGADLEIAPREALALSMAMYELATNASKYGALSSPAGRVSVEWRLQNGNLILEWQESGGPPVTRPVRKGFGSRLLERLLSRDLGGDISLDYDPGGFKFSIRAPLSSTTSDASASSAMAV